MLFNTPTFAFYFIEVYLLYLLFRRNLRAQNILMTIASYVFYGSWDWRFLSLLFISTVNDYNCAIRISESENPKTRKFYMWLSVAVNLSMLCFFKYYNFFALNLQRLLHTMGADVQMSLLHVILPVGISFYTFQTMCYTFDVYNRKTQPTRDFLNYCLYVNYFPTLVAGPIERGNNLLTQILRPRNLERHMFFQGIYLIYWGLFLKSFMADNLAKIVDTVFSGPPPYAGGDVLLGTYAFAFQIYGDFAGYSFMAIGIGWMLGFDMIYNFKRPYFSLNIGEFWRRWHISLSSWFRDYVFTPYYANLDRSEKFKNLSMKARHNILFFISLMVTELMLGFWHGANWNFGLFGLYHGFLIWLYYSFRRYWDKLPVAVQMFLTFHLACIGWLIFRVTSITMLGNMIEALVFRLGETRVLDFVQTVKDMLFFVWLVPIVELIDRKKEDAMSVMRLPAVARWFLYILFFVLIASWGTFGERQFIYFQF